MNGFGELHGKRVWQMKKKEKKKKDKVRDPERD